MNKKALRALLRERRALIAPESHGFTRPTGQGRRAPGLSQHQVDQLLHRTLGTYHRLESGSYPNPPTVLLRDVALLFDLDEQEWVSLCRYALLQDPPGPLHQSSGKEIPGFWQDALDSMSHMAYISDASWDLIAYNSAFAALFPDLRVPSNTMRWMLLEPQGRELLIDWHNAWAPWVLPQLRAALATRPDDETLLQIEKEVLADPETSATYETGATLIHADGHERPIQHAINGPGWVSICAAQPMTAPGSRLFILVFRPGYQRPVHHRQLLRAPASVMDGSDH
ncbi:MULTISPECIES: helix-turn-helix domain-containing protein [unclassified Streptomyces]|uniref:MmyB family transcriptional regulator n=1 Tax=unclassified Streptomyces TaxID=2593676 RepID=UPI000DB95C7E|nr:MULTISPECIES: helix-turn-helix domain-containing protein [unclassified Streptomyces]MYT73723.1 helix-turn-helix domain-containing protein [Streptomyces sp. SID8367]RAJ85264.1 helix-turn-helix protein [Streptomyces sp. PsTaAH-137]